jgi:predicted Zn-dependent protease
MLKVITLFILVILISGCEEVDSILGGNKSKKDVTYSYSCLDSSMGGKPVSRRLDQVGNVIRDLVVSEKSITDSVQTTYGLLFHKQMVEEGTFKLVNDRALNDKLNRVLNQLLDARKEPSNIRYAVYVLKDTTVNAFTFGGRIYITQGMLQKCEDQPSILYFIMGHEIGHSEVGHIKNTIQELEVSNKIFGQEGGATFLGLKRMLTASSNQRNELEADYYGINLTNELGYDVCTAVSFWKEMASRENQYSEVEDFFRTHPFSNLRSECLTNHIRTNFNKDCGDLNKRNSLPQVVNE